MDATHTRTHARTHQPSDPDMNHQQRSAHTLRHTQTHSDTLRHTQTHSDTLRHTQTHSHTLTHLRLHPLPGQDRGVRSWRRVRPLSTWARCHWGAAEPWSGIRTWTDTPAPKEADRYTDRHTNAYTDTNTHTRLHAGGRGGRGPDAVEPVAAAIIALPFIIDRDDVTLDPIFKHTVH